MPSFQLGLIFVLLCCLRDTPCFAASLASSSLRLNAAVTLDLVALPGSPTVRTLGETDRAALEDTVGMRNAIGLPVGGRNTHGATQAGR
jgi:hypothetical protein